MVRNPRSSQILLDVTIGSDVKQPNYTQLAMQKLSGVGGEIRNVRQEIVSDKAQSDANGKASPKADNDQRTQDFQSLVLEQIKKELSSQNSKGTESDVNGEIPLDSFMKAMEKKYQRDFIKQLRQHSYNTISQEQAGEYFRTFVKALYDNRIVGLGKGYGYFSEGGAEGERGRQNLVEAFSEDVSGFIRRFGPIAAQGSTLLWSSFDIGRFAVDDKDILRSAGVTDENAQPLDQTKIGKLWDKLQITTESDKQIGYTWDNQSQVWNAVSKEFAANAEGDVEVFLPKNISSMSIFWNVELPELRKRMKPFMDPPKVNNITIHRLTDEALDEVSKINKRQSEWQKKLQEATTKTERNKFQAEIDKCKQEKKQVMLKTDYDGNSRSWENLDFSEATLEVPKFSEQQQKLLKDSNPILYEQVDNYVKSNDVVGEITIRKLNNIAKLWKAKAKAPSGIDTQLYQKIAEKYGHLSAIPPSIINDIEQGIAPDNQITQYADRLVTAFQDDLTQREPQKYNDSDLEIITRLLHQNYTRLQKPSSIDTPTKAISKAEIENLLKKTSGDPTLAGFSNLNQYSQKLSAGDTIKQFGLDYQYQDNSGQTVKPYLMSEEGKDKTLPFIYYVATPMTDDIKNNAKIPLDPVVKTKLEAIANDSTRDDNDELKKMAKELTTPGVYHELTPNTGNDQPKYGTQTDGKKSYADMLRTTYSTSSSQLSPGATIRAKGPNGEDVKIADWDGMTWTVSPQSAAELPDWLKSQGRTEDRLNVETELKPWKTVGDNQITPPSNIPVPVRSFMEHHFQTSLEGVTIQKVNSTDNDDSTSTVIKFKPGEYDDSTVDGLKKIANKLGDAVKLKVASNGNQPDVSKAITQINNDLPTKSVSLKNELMKLRKPRTSFADTVNRAKKIKSRYNTGKESSKSTARRRASSKQTIV